MDIAKLKELLGEATPGPWEAGAGGPNEPETTVYCDDSLGSAVATCAHRGTLLISPAQERTNAALIVAAVNALPSLIARVEAAEKVAAEMTDFVEQEAEVWLDTVDAWRCRLNPTYNQESAK